MTNAAIAIIASIHLLLIVPSFQFVSLLHLFAMERSPVRDTEIKVLLADVLCDCLDDTTLLARSIDASYAYEGYAAFLSEKLGL